MSEKLPTVKIANPANTRTGYKIINASAFNPKVHKLFEEADEPASPVVDGVKSSKADDKNPLDALTELGDAWREAHGAKLKSIAAALSGRTPANKDEAVAVIEAAIVARDAAPAVVPPPPPA